MKGATREVDHVVHFYHLHALDWVDVTSALKAGPARPLEILRTIHSFDPCIACAVHVLDAKGRKYSLPKAV